MDNVVHFEIPWDDKDRAKKFYSEIFGWKLMEMPDMGYVLVQAADTDDKHMVQQNGAINGGLFKRNDAAPVSVIVIHVASIDETVKKVEASGGKLITPKQPIPNGSYARVKDSEGNVIGIVDGPSA